MFIMKFGENLQTTHASLLYMKRDCNKDVRRYSSRYKNRKKQISTMERQSVPATVAKRCIQHTGCKISVGPGYITVREEGNIERARHLMCYCFPSLPIPQLAGHQPVYM
jgi:hypothetical protein